MQIDSQLENPPLEDALWGPETEKAVANFPVSGSPIPPEIIHSLGAVKAAAARTNAKLGLLDERLANAIAKAGDDVSAGRYDDHFPIDVFQTGSGTSSNMNANEVIASLAGGDVHPNDHVNMGQSSNDVFPSAVHLAALSLVKGQLIPALDRLSESLATQAAKTANVVKAGRTHLMDAVPVMLGAEFQGYATQIALGRDRIEATLGRVAQIPLGGTATGTGLNTDPNFASGVRTEILKATGVETLPPADPFESQGNRDALVELSGALKVVAVSMMKIANDIRWLSSGPRAGLAEIVLPELQKGSSIMPGKVNPVIPEVVCQVSAQVIGNDTAITVGGLSGNLELNVMIPLIARNLLDSISLQAAAARLFADKCVDGIEADEDACERHAEATLAAATALNVHVGYDKATEIVKSAHSSGKTLREAAREADIDEGTLSAALDLRRMALGNKAGNA